MAELLTAKKLLAMPATFGNSPGSGNSNRDHFAPLLSKLHRQIRMVNTYRDGARRVIWAKFPSEKSQGVAYDVVLTFTPQSSTSPSLWDDRLEIYSNSPFFTFNIAHVAEQNKWIVPELRTRLERQVRKNAPEQRNPDGELRSDKTIITTLLKAEQLGWMQSLAFDGTRPQPLPKRAFVTAIQTNEDMLVKRRKARAIPDGRTPAKPKKPANIPEKKRSGFTGMTSMFDGNKKKKSNMKSFKSMFDKK